MRRRLLGAILLVVAAALVLFAVPLAAAVRGVLVDRALDRLEGEVQQVGTFIERQARTCAELQLWLAVASQEDLDVALFDGRGVLRFAAGQDPAAGGAEVAEAARGRIGRVHAEGRLRVALPVSTRACGGPLILRGSTGDDAVAGSVRGAWLGIGAVGAAVLLVAAAAALWTGRRLSAPFEELAASARRLGLGDFSARAPHSGLPEADEIADALDVTADRLGRAVQRGAAFTADASHQLRTPLTALRLHLERLEDDDPDDEAVAAALAEADRLDATIDELVALTRLDAAGDAVDVAGIVAERVRAWRRNVESAGREVTVEQTAPAPPVRVRAAALGQALQVLLDNALEHGQGPIRVRMGPTLPDAAVQGAQVCVVDEGPGFEPERVLPASASDRGALRRAPVRGGRGLVLARSLVEGEGGRLVVTSSPAGTRACLVLRGG